ncbi:MAG: DUF4388 domain-containing protein [Actinomycetota bacterium]|jgi:hypothetical protein|nr:DUF4388 domain-containing protein [Actinomycetota bacterium]MCL6092269.1 DUF4388 domain-containing protein [Actinomycetota bacterium]MDA8167574.1 DUF4388 domain-containing protein [Actinomycetota bacterium]
MILWGKISHFSVFMVLQLLASYNKTGQLEIEDNEERATIYLMDGFVEAVSVPRSDHLLGAKLVKAGHLSQTDLRKVILASALRDDKREFLGLTLMKSGMVEPEIIAGTITEQAYENTLELSNWVEGTFKFTSPRQPVVFPFPPRINVQHLLLETSRRLDEGQRPSKSKAVLPGDELCHSCSANCTEAQKDKYLKDGICLWRNMPVITREAIFAPENTGFGGPEDIALDIPFL